MIDIGELSLIELKKLQKDVAKAIDGFKERQRREALNAVEAMAKEMGFNLSDLLDVATKKAKITSPPKYQHPEDPSLTWTGRGRQPAWLKKAEKAGKSRDEFLIEK